MSASSSRHLASRHLASLTLLRLAAAAVVLPAAAFTAPSVLAAQSGPALPKGMTRVTSVEGITEYRLQNGLRVLLAPDASKPTTTVNMTYMVGSRHENYGETGMAHLLEHMLFKGTPTLRNALGEFSRRGLRANGSTWTDRTNYFASFAANEDNLDWYLGWQADAMINSLIARKDLDTER
jgi:zinc protease